ncbi:MAG TPA: ABC transporter substrate-binding protein [Aliidongia sp.]|uniref:ABC transporter substrate-binding protein n=1 Tax=Aliidongia sp. TaxID=1914230 RepID=UPI002DDC99E0|nr:ABC transporter substrate-binding protein [Aliidongia sp.]HEV2674751.1 ABC transporter substrate-binding protein [Aliidongia sp.]
MSAEPSPRRTVSRRTVLQASLATALTAVAGPARAATPFFKLYLMIPNSQPARMVWGTLAAAQMSRIGIDVVSSFVPFTVIAPRRAGGEGKTHVDGGWDSYLERYYYPSIEPSPYTLFGSTEMPPSGQNFYYVGDKEIDRSLLAVANSLHDSDRLQAYHDFEKRWYDIQPMTILFYPQDVIAVNPKLTGFDATTYNPTFYPQPEHWTIDGAGADGTAAFASWPPPSSLIPMYTISYHESNIFGPAYNRLYEYRSWQDKTLIPALATGHTMSDDGKHWVVALRQGVKWHSGEEFTAADVKFTWDAMLNKAYSSQMQATCSRVFGDPSAYKVTGKYEITVDLPAYSLDFLNTILGALAIMPEHAYKDIKPEALRSHSANTWIGSYTVKTSDGKSFTAHGAVGTGPWIPTGFDPSRKAYGYKRNEAYWKPHTGNVKTFYIVNINGTDAALSALKAGEIDAHDPMYDIGPVVSTIDAGWGKVVTFDSYKWQHICYNLKHPVFGVGTETPLGKSDPSRAAEAAAYIRQAISHAMPRDQIVKEIAGGYGAPGTVPMAWSAPEYDHDLLQPIAYDLDLARKYMEKAGYTY